MGEFIQALGAHAFLRQALAAGLLSSVACGVVGTYVVTRRITIIAGSLAHTVVGGMGAAYWLRATRGWEWLHPLYGAVAAAVLGAVLIGVVRNRGRGREDTVISALWAVGMATGVMFLFQTPGYKADLNLIDYERLRLDLPYVVHDLPGGAKRLIQKADGYVATIVSGQVTFREGEDTGVRPGKVIRGPQAIAS